MVRWIAGGLYQESVKVHMVSDLCWFWLWVGFILVLVAGFDGGWAYSGADCGRAVFGQDRSGTRMAEVSPR